MIFPKREQYRQLWEESVQKGASESSLNIKFMPLDPEAFTNHPMKLPNGETYYENYMDVVQINF